MPGCSESHAATVSTVRSGSRSIGRRVSTSTRTVPKDPAFAERELVDPQDRDARRGRVGKRADLTQNHVPARLHRQVLGQPGTGPAAHGQTDRLHDPGNCPRAPSIRGSQARDLLGHRPAVAPVVVAEEPPDTPEGGVRRASRPAAGPRRGVRSCCAHATLQTRRPGKRSAVVCCGHRCVLHHRQSRPRPPPTPRRQATPGPRSAVRPPRTARSMLTAACSAG